MVRGRNPEAVSELKAALAVQPTNREAQYLLTTAYRNMGNQAQAHTILVQLAKINDKFGNAAKRILGEQRP